MLKKIEGAVSITWREHTASISLSKALIMSAIAALAIITLTTIVVFLFWGISAIEVLALILLTSALLGAGLWFGKDYLLGRVFVSLRSQKMVNPDASVTPAEGESDKVEPVGDSKSGSDQTNVEA